MVSVTTKVMTPGERRKANLQRIKDAAPQIKGVRVEPASVNLRRLLKHPRAGGFRSEGSVEWPSDTFTFRRLKEGSVRLVEEKPAEEKPADKPSGSARSKEGV
jgi:hypothetical protein